MAAYRDGLREGEAQLEPEIRHAVFGNAGLSSRFAVGAEDATYIVQEFHEKYEKIDFLQLPNYRTRVKLMIDGTPSKPFSAVTLAPSGLQGLSSINERLPDRTLRGSL